MTLPDNPAAERPPTRPTLRFRALRTITALILREMITTYGRSPGGYIWAILQPVGVIIMLTVAFSLILRSPSLGTSFVLFYATGILPMRLFQEISGAVANAIQFNRALMGYPRVTYIDTLIARASLGLLTQIMVSCVVLTGVYLIEDVNSSINFIPIINAYLLAFFLAFGIGSLNCFLMGYFPVWKTIWGIFTRPLMLMSAVIYIYEDLPRGAQDILWYNPLAHVMGLSRDGFFITYGPQYISQPYVLAWALLPMCMGQLLLYRFHRDMLTR